MKMRLWIMALLAFALAGCQAAFRGEEGGAQYIGRPGFLIEFTSGGFSLYLGPDGNVTTRGTAALSAGSAELRELFQIVSDEKLRVDLREAVEREAAEREAAEREAAERAAGQPVAVDPVSDEPPPGDGG